MRKKLTKSVVEASGLGFTMDTEVRGFGVRRQLKGTALGDAAYILRYRFEREERLHTIGWHGSPWTLTEARAEAQRILGEVARGVDPRKAPALDVTLGQILDPPEGSKIKSYLDYIAKELRPHSVIETTRSLRQHWAPLHRTPLRKLDRLTIGEVIDDIAVDRPAAAVRARSALSSCLTWAMRKGYLDINPVNQTLPPSEGEVERTRVLTPDELRRLWLATDPDTPFGRIVRLLILTGCRRAEIGSLTWTDIDLDAGTLTIPEERAKNGHELVLPLTPMMRDQLPPQGRGPFLFARRGGFNVWKHAGPLWRKAKIGPDASGVTPVLHDIRRTVASLMRKELGIAPHVIAEILNHTLGAAHGVGGSTGIYITERDSAAMREALTQWGWWVIELVTGAKKAA